MISVVLYGRNDSYGYNLHKRAALSFNCIAELLTDPDDEILFVDYNTPDDFPTFPEAIQDTLTAKAQARLRILRVRPEVHARFKDRTHLQALEPVARNVAVRRSNPANRWILSTNTDMIFVPRDGQTLTEQVRDLPKGYYGIPRFEIPESLWETLDRLDPIGTIQTVGDWGWRFHLNEIVYGAPIIKFDAPGDFQLIDRADLIDMHGFDEDMLLGWHVDSNICKRLFLKYGTVGDLSGKLFGYHCDHTRQVTPAHKRAAVENSISKFVDEVTAPGLPKQAASWGGADAAIEELRLSNSSGRLYLDALSTAIQNPMVSVSEVSYTGASHDTINYSPDHVLPYVADVLSSAPRHWNVAWFGADPQMLDLFARAWPVMGFTGSILVSDTDLPTGFDNTDPRIVAAGFEEVCERADTFIFNFPGADDLPPAQARVWAGQASAKSSNLMRLVPAFYRVVAIEQQRAMNGTLPPRRVIAINAIHNRFEPLMRGHIEYARSPLSGRLRHGYVLPSVKDGVPWLELMILKRAAERAGPSVMGRQFVRGYMLSGPFVSLGPDHYKVVIQTDPIWPSTGKGWARLLGALVSGMLLPNNGPVSSEESFSDEGAEEKSSGGKWSKRGAVTVSLMNERRVLSRRRLSAFSLCARRRHEIEFSIGQEDIEALYTPVVKARIWTAGHIGFKVKSIDLWVRK